MISIRRMSLGSGYRYLMESVAVGDGAGWGSSMFDYYAQSGTPAGRFLGAGLAGLADGKGVPAGSTVTEEHLFRMLGMCADPVTGKPLGRAPNQAVASLQRRIAERIKAIPEEVTGVERAQMIAEIEAEEQTRSGGIRLPVAGFDLTFSPSKTVSVAWALADAETKAIIYACHLRAIEIVLTYAEAEVFRSRSGTDGVVEEDIFGVIAAAFTHWDSRSGDPQLHDHLIVLNRAQSVSDGKWRTLDSRGLFKAVVALSELHQGVLSDLLTEALGWGWDGRPRPHSDRLAFEVTGVPAALMAEFSQRSAAIETRKNELIAEFVKLRGRQPTATEVIRLRQQATLETRPDKTHRSLAEMTDDWSQRAVGYLGEEPESWVASMADSNQLPLLRSEDLEDGILDDVARVAVEKVAATRATFSRWNVAAEVHRQLHGVRFATPAERIGVAERAVSQALARALVIDPPVLHSTPERFLRPDGTSRFRSKGRETYTTAAILDAEARLLDAGRRLDSPTASPAHPAHRLDGVSIDQAIAVEKIATSGRFLDVLVGPAGSGKSKTMRALRTVWEAQHGPGSVVGLAPSAAAAEVLAIELGVATENTAKWLTEHRRQPDRQANLDRLSYLSETGGFTDTAKMEIGQELAVLQADIDRFGLRAGQLLIIDEASLAGTFAMDELVSAAANAGAKILLVGDPAQIGSVEAGGMFASLVTDRDHPPELTGVHRFTAEWEKQASVALRAGDEGAIDTYHGHRRIIGGARDEALDALYAAWRADIDAGKSSLMIAPDTTTVAELNRRAQHDRILAGTVNAAGVDVAGGGQIGVGDLVITRHNDRTITGGGRWIKNGDRWTVTGINDDGSITVQGHAGRASVTLPATYVAEHVELGYAVTAYRCRGRTLDTAHAFVSPTTTREALYVSATRGRDANHLYVDTSFDPDPDTGHDRTMDRQGAREVLATVLANPGSDISAHEAIRRAHRQAESIAALAAEYQTIGTAAQGDRYSALLARCGLTPVQLDAVRTSDAYKALSASLDEAEERGLDVERTFPALVRGRTLAGVDDPAKVLHHRVNEWLHAHPDDRTRPKKMIAGIVPRATGKANDDAAVALAERAAAMIRRAEALAETALSGRMAWVAQLGQPPAQPETRLEWLAAVATVAAYRERWGIRSNSQPFGDQPTVPTTSDQLRQLRQAVTAAHRARAISGQDHGPGVQRLDAPEPSRSTPHHGIEL